MRYHEEIIQQLKKHSVEIIITSFELYSLDVIINAFIIKCYEKSIMLEKRDDIVLLDTIFSKNYIRNKK